MSIPKMTLLVVAMSLIGAVLGALAGLAIATLTPDLYRAWFPPTWEQDNPDPVQIGVGLGIIQGIGMGFILGCVVLIATAIRSRKLVPNAGGNEPS